MRIDMVNLSKRYEGRENYTLENINLTIVDNDFFVILGPSGCGKTTLLRMVAGLSSITKGDLLFDGIRVNGLASKDRDIAMVFQSYALFPHLTNYQNIAYGLKVRKERKDIIDRRTRDVAHILKVEEYLANKPADISGGQRQRIALGRAIARKPKLFLMDEPLSNLDAKLRETMRTELVKIHKLMNATTIYVTHDQLEAMTMATKIIVMNNQKIQQLGTPRQLYLEPQNIFVAKFIGSPTMNIYSGTVKNGEFISLNEKVHVKLTAEQDALVKKCGTQKITMGIRSEDVYIARDKKTTNTSGLVTVCEMLGKEQKMEVAIDDTEIINVTLAADLEMDKQVSVDLSFNVKRMHLFNSITSQRIN